MAKRTSVFEQICAEQDRLKAMTPEQIEADAIRFETEVHIARSTLREHGAASPIAWADEVDQAEQALSLELDDSERRRRLGISD